MDSPLVIIDYGMGNLRSVERKVARHHPDVRVSANPDVIAGASKLVLPGVGHFTMGVQNLKAKGIWDVLNQKVLIEQTPILGICLGMQLMARHSEEGDTAGLGWFNARVVRFRVEDRLRYKIPHMGWNTIRYQGRSSLFTDVPESAAYYFVHAYHLVCEDTEDVAGETTYAYPFVSVIEKQHIVGTQFHPEKSHDWGERLIANFCGMMEDTSPEFGISHGLNEPKQIRPDPSLQV